MNKATALDRLDIRILEALQADGRITNKDLAERVNLSPSACHQRAQNLIEAGWITGFLGMLEIDRLCEPVRCITTISLGSHATENFSQLEHYINRLPECTQAYTVSGNCDMIAHFACTGMSRYMALTNEITDHCPQVKQLNTYVVLQQCKAFTGYDLKTLMPR